MNSGKYFQWEQIDFHDNDAATYEYYNNLFIYCHQLHFCGFFCIKHDSADVKARSLTKQKSYEVQFSMSRADLEWSRINKRNHDVTYTFSD